MVFVLYLYLLNLYLQELLTGGFIKEKYNDMLKGFGFNVGDNVEWSAYSKQGYTKYFIDKMEIINVLKTFTTFKIRYLSFYCYVCDKVESTECSWEKHAVMHDLDIITQNIYCSSCSLFICGCNIENHCSTREHWDFMQILHNLKAAGIIEYDECDKDEVLTSDVEHLRLMFKNASETNGN